MFATRPSTRPAACDVVTRGDKHPCLVSDAS
jgi:hypothetical protein